MPPKARVGVRIKEAVGGNKNSLNRSADLTVLTEKYNLLQAKQKSLIVALKNHHASIVRMSKSRVQVADQLAEITKGSELFGCAGQLPTEGMARNEVCSYASIHHNLATRTKTYADKYGQFVVNYAIEWDKVVTARVSKGLKEAEQLRRDLDHYQKKVESLRTSVNQVMAKGKQVDSKVQERLSRNDEKLQAAKSGYNKFATDMCLLIEEVTERAWKDIHPMLLKIAQFDSTLSSDETKALSELSMVQDKLKRLAETHQLKPQARLKDIETLTPALLSTRQDGGLRLEADPNASGAFGDMSSPMAMPPGSVSPQGMGGYPVPVSSSFGVTSRNSSISSFASAPAGYGSSTMNTSDMLTIAAASAPPPTMDQVNDATGALSISPYGSNPYSSFGPPPTHDSYRRSSSMPDYGPGAYNVRSVASSFTNDTDSISSYVSAPAPSAPPPPPPGGMSMYASTPGTASPMSMYGAPVAAPMPYGSPVPAPLPPTYGIQQSTQYAQPWSNGGQNPYGGNNTDQFGAPAPLSNTNPFDN